jgi:hypothetical protein
MRPGQLQISFWTSVAQQNYIACPDICTADQGDRIEIDGRYKILTRPRKSSFDFSFLDEEIWVTLPGKLKPATRLIVGVCMDIRELRAADKDSKLKSNVRMNPTAKKRCSWQT